MADRDIQVPGKDWRFAVQDLIDAGRAIKPGELFSFPAMSEIVGRPVKGGDSIWQTAKERLSRDHNIEFGNERAEGYVRLTDSGIVGRAAPERLERIQRQHKRLARALSNVRDYRKLSRDERIKFDVYQATIGAIGLVSHGKTVAKAIEARKANETIDTDSVLALCRRRPSLAGG